MEDIGGYVVFAIVVFAVVLVVSLKKLGGSGEKPNVDYTSLQDISSNDLLEGKGSFRGDHLKRNGSDIEGVWKRGRFVPTRLEPVTYEPATRHQGKKGQKVQGDSIEAITDRSGDFRTQITYDDGKTDYDDDGMYNAMSLDDY